MIMQIKHTKQGLLNRHFFKILTIFFFILVLVFWSSIRSLMLETLSPMLQVGNSFLGNFGGFFKNFSDKDKLIEENNRLLADMENAKFNLVDYESIKSENQKLRETLKMRSTTDLITTVVIAKPPQTPLDSLYLDKGAAEGLTQGDLVSVGERILIGKIVKTAKHTSIVSLNSLAGAITYGFVDRTNEMLEINGVGGGGMEAKVPIDFDIVVGDKLMIANSFTYLAAVVGMIEEDRSSGFKNVLMSLPVNIPKTNIVFVSPVNGE